MWCTDGLVVGQDHEREGDDLLEDFHKNIDTSTNM